MVEPNPPHQASNPFWSFPVTFSLSVCNAKAMGVSLQSILIYLSRIALKFCTDICAPQSMKTCLDFFIQHHHQIRVRLLICTNPGSGSKQAWLWPRLKQCKVFARFRHTQFSLSSSVLVSGAPLAYCFLEAEESDCVIDQQIGLQSLAQCFTVLMEHCRESNMCQHREHTHCLLCTNRELKLHLDAGVITTQPQNVRASLWPRLVVWLHASWCLLNEALQWSLLCQAATRLVNLSQSYSFIT